MKLTDKELKELADKGVFTNANKTRSIKLFYISQLQVGSKVTEALNSTSSKFGISSRQIQRVIFNK